MATNFKQYIVTAFNDAQVRILGQSVQARNKQRLKKLNFYKTFKFLTLDFCTWCCQLLVFAGIGAKKK